MLLAAVEPGQAGPLGTVVLLLLIAAAGVLFRSMSKHLRRVPRSFDEQPPTELP